MKEERLREIQQLHNRHPFFSSSSSAREWDRTGVSNIGSVDDDMMSRFARSKGSRTMPLRTLMLDPEVKPLEEGQRAFLMPFCVGLSLETIRRLIVLGSRETSCCVYLSHYYVVPGSYLTAGTRHGRKYQSVRERTVHIYPWIDCPTPTLEAIEKNSIIIMPRGPLSTPPYP